MRSALEFVSVDGHLNFACPRVGITAIVGDSHSRAFRLAVGLERPTAGAVVVLGSELSRARGRARAKTQRRMAVVLGGADRGLFGTVSVRDNVLFAVRAAGRSGRRGADALVDDTLADLDLSAVADARPDDLDDAARDRLAVARALALRSPLLVMDAFDRTADADALAAAIRADRFRLGAAAVLFCADAGLAGSFANEVVHLDACVAH